MSRWFRTTTVDLAEEPTTILARHYSPPSMWFSRNPLSEAPPQSGPIVMSNLPQQKGITPCSRIPVLVFYFGFKDHHHYQSRTPPPSPFQTPRSCLVCSFYELSWFAWHCAAMFPCEYACRRFVNVRDSGGRRVCV
jgi:hypothetical protein